MLLTNFLSSKKGWFVRGANADVGFNSMLEFSAEKASRLPDEPIEQGSFATYNRVIEPIVISCRLAVEGYPSQLHRIVDRLTTLSENDEKVVLVTPEQTYQNMMLESFDYRRDSMSGRGVLFVDLRLKEIREVKSAQTTTSVEEPIEAEDCEDGSCVDDIEDGEVQASDADDFEEETAERKVSTLEVGRRAIFD